MQEHTMSAEEEKQQFKVLSKTCPQDPSAITKKACGGNNNNNNNDQNKIDEKVDEKPFSGALEALRNFRKMRKENPDFDASF